MARNGPGIIPTADRGVGSALILEESHAASAPVLHRFDSVVAGRSPRGRCGSAGAVHDDQTPIFSFAAATIGGLDSPVGALVGGVIVAMAQTLVPGYIPFISTDLSLLPPLVVMGIVLLIQPTGLFGTRRVERV